RRRAAERRWHSRGAVRTWRHLTRARGGRVGFDRRDRARHHRIGALCERLVRTAERCMAQLTHEHYDRLERAVMNGTRLIFKRSGRREYVIIPLAFRVENGRELVEA